VTILLNLVPLQETVLTQITKSLTRVVFTHRQLKFVTVTVTSDLCFIDFILPSCSTHGIRFHSQTIFLLTPVNMSGMKCDSYRSLSKPPLHYLISPVYICTTFVPKTQFNIIPAPQIYAPYVKTGQLHTAKPFLKI
jgi:hypothetical protein